MRLILATTVILVWAHLRRHIVAQVQVFQIILKVLTSAVAQPFLNRFQTDFYMTEYLQRCPLVMKL